jgi:hypothetical protein
VRASSDGSPALFLAASKVPAVKHSEHQPLQSTSSGLGRVARPFALVLVALTFTLSYSWMSPEVNAPNERTRLYLTLSIVEDGDVAVTEQVERYGTIFDLAERDDEFYSDKAPGASVLAVPFVGAYVAAVDDVSIEKVVTFARTFVMVPFALLTIWLLRHLLLGIGVQRDVANVTAVAFAVGTNFLHYGAAFFGHSLVTCATLAAAVAMLRAFRCEHQTWRTAWQALAGFAGGLAFAIEYQAAIVCVAIAVAYLSRRDNWTPSAVLAPLLAALIPIGLTLLYNNAAFGGPLETSYAHLHHQVSAEIHDKGLFGITLPTLDALYGLVLSPSRGLLLCAPIALLGWFGLSALWHKARWLAIYAGISMFGYMMLIAGFDVWYGGWGFGPRMLVPIYGLSAVAAGCMLERVREASSVLAATIAGLLVAGFAYNVFVTSMFPEIPHDVKAPLPTIAVPLAEAGSPSPNLGMTLFGLDGWWSVAPMYIVALVLMGYLLCTYLERPLRSLRQFAAATMAVVLFATAVFGYPESYGELEAHTFVKQLSELRTQPR